MIGGLCSQNSIVHSLLQQYFHGYLILTATIFTYCKVANQYMEWCTITHSDWKSEIVLISSKYGTVWTTGIRQGDVDELLYDLWSRHFQDNSLLANWVGLQLAWYFISDYGPIPLASMVPCYIPGNDVTQQHTCLNNDDHIIIHCQSWDGMFK